MSPTTQQSLNKRLRFHIGSLHHSFPDGGSALSGISPARYRSNLTKLAGALRVFRRLAQSRVSSGYG